MNLYDFTIQSENNSNMSLSFKSFHEAIPLKASIANNWKKGPWIHI